jgi:SPX domain protein involved in polyphosphate accumulation
MQRQRFELKYVLNEFTALRIREFVQSYLNLDESGLGQPDFAYRVNSIYLDSDALDTFWDWVNANRNRYKLRMRFYDSQPDTPVFMEIKRRIDGCILKQRCGIRKQAAALVLGGQLPEIDDIVTRDAKGKEALEEFIVLLARLQAKPKALVTYLREAYIDPQNEGVRVTLDREVQISPCSTCDFNLKVDRFTQPFGEKVILELKFNNRFPEWLHEMVQPLNLTRTAAAKYCEGVSALWHPELSNSLDGRLEPYEIVPPREAC